MNEGATNEATDFARKESMTANPIARKGEEMINPPPAIPVAQLCEALNGAMDRIDALLRRIEQGDASRADVIRELRAIRWRLMPPSGPMSLLPGGVAMVDSSLGWGSTK